MTFWDNEAEKKYYLKTMNLVVNLVSGCIFVATISSCVASEALIDDDLVWEADPKSIISSGGSLYASLNATLITYVLIGVAGLIAVGYVLYALSTSEEGLPFSSKQSQSYYDPTSDVNADAALEYDAGYLQNANESHQYRRRRAAYEQSKFYAQKINILAHLLVISTKCGSIMMPMIVCHHNTPMIYIHIYIICRINTIYKRPIYSFQYCTKIKILTYCNAHPCIMLCTHKPVY